MQIDHQVFHGPSLYGDFAGLLIKYKQPTEHSLSTKKLEKQLLKHLSFNKSFRKIYEPGQDLSFNQCFIFILIHLYEPRAFYKLNCLTSGYERKTGLTWVYLRYLRITPTILAVKLALELSFSIFSKPKQIEKASFLERRDQITTQEVSNDMQVMISIALKRGIPIYPATSSYSRLWQYGQGCRSHMTMFTVTQKDSIVGEELCKFKNWSREYISKLGYPTPEQHLINHYDHALKAAKSIGFPVVVKPVNGTMGKGITTAINNTKDLKTAYHIATSQTSPGTLVEKHIDGLDHRLMVFQGKFVFAFAKHPAHVIGDGKSNIRELIHQENKRRAKSPDTIKKLTMDKDTDRALKSQALNYDDCPKVGQLVELRSVSNLSMGGVSVNVTEQVHPDNIAMAETLARLFRMSVMGLDFITKDISRSWKDSPCAIIEVNHVPAYTEVWQAELIMNALFPKEEDGRIPTFLLVNLSEEKFKAVEKKLKASGLCIGIANKTSTILGTEDRGKTSDSLQTRVNSLIADPLCEALLIAIDQKSLIHLGLPLDKFDIIMSSDITPNISKFLDQHASHHLSYPILKKEETSTFDLIGQLLTDFKSLIGKS